MGGFGACMTTVRRLVMATIRPVIAAMYPRIMRWLTFRVLLEWGFLRAMSINAPAHDGRCALCSHVPEAVS
jgi:hypothetical protein